MRLGLRHWLSANPLMRGETAHEWGTLRFRLSKSAGCVLVRHRYCELLIAKRLHDLFDSGALLACEWEMRQARLPAEVAVEVAGVFECCWRGFGELGSCDDSGLLLFGE